MGAYFLILWVSWSCQGDQTVLGLKIRPIPAPVRSVAASLAVSGRPVCWPVPEASYLANREEAARKVRDLGPTAGARVSWCQRLRCYPKPVEWRPELYFDGKAVK